MPAMARAIAHALPNTSFSIKPSNSEVLDKSVLFYGAGLLAVLLLITQDLDIGTRFF